jgi:hypothetical protein
MKKTAGKDRIYRTGRAGQYTDRTRWAGQYTERTIWAGQYTDRTRWAEQDEQDRMDRNEWTAQNLHVLADWIDRKG